MVFGQNKPKWGAIAARAGAILWFACVLQAAFDTGDHLHLSPAGFAAMAAVPFERLATCACQPLKR